MNTQDVLNTLTTAAGSTAAAITVSDAAPVPVPANISRLIQQHYYPVSSTSSSAIRSAVSPDRTTVRFVTSGGILEVPSAGRGPEDAAKQIDVEASFRMLSPYVSVELRRAWISIWGAYKAAVASNTAVSGAWSAFAAAHDAVVKNASQAPVTAAQETGSNKTLLYVGAGVVAVGLLYYFTRKR